MNGAMFSHHLFLRFIRQQPVQGITPNLAAFDEQVLCDSKEDQASQDEPRIEGNGNKKSDRSSAHRILEG
jgi:hypothetical protein